MPRRLPVFLLSALGLSAIAQTTTPRGLFLGEAPAPVSLIYHAAQPNARTAAAELAECLQRIFRQDFTIREVDFLRRHRAAAGHRLELKEFVLAHTAFLRETFRKQPFAVNVFDITRDTWPLWRDCGLYAR